MQVQAINSVNFNFKAKNATIIEGEFLKNGAMIESIVSKLNENSLYREFCNSNDTKTVLSTMHPNSTCVAVFGMFYKPAKKGIMKLFSFLTPYKYFSFGGYGKDYKQACNHLKTEMFDPIVGLLNDRLTENLSHNK